MNRVGVAAFDRRPMLLVLATLATALAAQDAAEPPFLGIVRTVSGRPVVGAEIRVVERTLDTPPWLATARAIRADGPAARSDARGRFRLPAGPGAAALLVTHGDGLGAFVDLAHRGDPAIVTADALGRLARADDSELGAWVRRVVPGGTLPLGHYLGPTLELPAGDYVLLVETEAGLVEHRCRVEAGRVERFLPRRGTHARLIGARPDRLHAERWPEVALDPAAPLPAPLGAETLVATFAGPPTVFAYSALASGTAQVAFSVPEHDVLDVSVRAPSGAPTVAGSVCAVAPDGVPRLVGRAWLADGNARVAAGPGDVLVVSAPGCEPRAIPPGVREALASESPGEPLSVRLAPADPLPVTVLEPDGAPRALARVEIAGGDPLLFAVAWTDRRGIAVLPFSGPEAVLTVRTGDHVPERLSRAALEARGGVVELARGASVLGVARLPDGRPAADVAVEIRDSTALLGIRPRSVVTDADGSFRFNGLPDGIYLLSARTERDGTTWSGQLRGVQPGSDEWLLELASEDPPLPGSRRKDTAR